MNQLTEQALKSTLSTNLDNFRLNFTNDKNSQFIPIMIGGMGVDISTSDLALIAARLGGIGHISDAMVLTVTDRRYQTSFTKNKQNKYKNNADNADKSAIKFDLNDLREATKIQVQKTMQQKSGSGLIFLNCMEKLTMNAPKETLAVRLNSALDAGIDGITLAAGLHLGSFALMAENPRFHHAKLGIIVSSLRALQLFLKKNQKFNRLPDYVVVEGPLAGGHLGFGIDDWKNAVLQNIVVEIATWLKSQNLQIPLIAAGGVFTGTDAVNFIQNYGAAGVQVATRFTITKECGLPEEVKQEYFAADKDDIEVNLQSPTGYPMRMLSHSPGLYAGTKPNCESYGYLLDNCGHCSYLDEYYAAVEKNSQNLVENKPEKKIIVRNKTCLCTHMRNFDIWTCGYNTFRLKDTSTKLADGTYQELNAEDVFNDYLYSKNNEVNTAKI